jgi:hypothetical protein
MGKLVSYRHEHKPLPNELLLMYRQRSGMTQSQLGHNPDWCVTADQAWSCSLLCSSISTFCTSKLGS